MQWNSQLLLPFFSPCLLPSLPPPFSVFLDYVTLKGRTEVQFEKLVSGAELSPSILKVYLLVGRQAFPFQSYQIQEERVCGWCGHHCIRSSQPSAWHIVDAHSNFFEWVNLHNWIIKLWNMILYCPKSINTTHLESRSPGSHGDPTRGNRSWSMCFCTEHSFYRKNVETKACGPSCKVYAILFPLPDLAAYFGLVFAYLPQLRPALGLSTLPNIPPVSYLTCPEFYVTNVLNKSNVPLS